MTCNLASQHLYGNELRRDEVKVESHGQSPRGNRFTDHHLELKELTMKRKENAGSSMDVCFLEISY